MACGHGGPGPVQLWGAALASAADKKPAGLRESFVTRLLAVNSFAGEVTKEKAESGWGGAGGGAVLSLDPRAQTRCVRQGAAGCNLGGETPSWISTSH